MSSTTTGNSTITLKVMEAYSRDFGQGIARIDQDSMGSLGLSIGECIEIRGIKSTVAKCMPLYLSDADQGILRVDELARRNAQTKIGESVAVIKIRTYPAERVRVDAT